MYMNNNIDCLNDRSKPLQFPRLFKKKNRTCISKQCVLLLFTGIAAGHIYYFLEDVFPQQPGGFKILKTPRFL